MDVRVERLIRASPADVAAVMFDPCNDPRWIGGAKAVDPPAGSPTAIGARVRRHGGFLGRSFSWVTEVTDHAPGRRLEMAFREGPMKGSVTYEIEPVAGGARVSVRNHGGADFGVPAMGWMLRRSVAKDLERLARLVES